MRNIQTANTKVMAYPAMQIWEAITDLPHYSSWWPSSIKIKTLHLSEGVIGSRIELRPYGGQAFCCEVSELKRGKELVLQYSGIYAGRGIWTISEINGQSRVTYEIKLIIQSNLIRLLSSVLPVNSIHSKLMEEVLTGLGQYLDKNERSPNQAL
jgi:hypothetical protein